MIPFEPSKAYFYMECWTDRSIDLWKELEQEEAKKERIQGLMKLIVPEQFLDQTRFIYLPSRNTDKSDPLGQRGYCGFTYIPLKEAEPRYDEKRAVVDHLFKEIRTHAISDYTFCITL